MPNKEVIAKKAYCETYMKEKFLITNFFGKQ